MNAVYLRPFKVTALKTVESEIYAYSYPAAEIIAKAQCDADKVQLLEIEAVVDVDLTPFTAAVALEGH